MLVHGVPYRLLKLQAYQFQQTPIAKPTTCDTPMIGLQFGRPNAPPRWPCHMNKTMHKAQRNIQICVNLILPIGGILLGCFAGMMYVFANASTDPTHQPFIYACDDVVLPSIVGWYANPYINASVRSLSKSKSNCQTLLLPCTGTTDAANAWAQRTFNHWIHHLTY